MAGNDLTFKIKSDSKLAQDDIKRLRKVVNDELKAIKTTGSNDIISFGKAYDSEMKRLGDSTNSFGVRAAHGFGISARGAAQLNSAVQGTAKAIAIIGTAALAAGTGIFMLAKNATDAGSEIYDASVKLGFMAESLSAVRNLAESSGGSLESASAALGIFNVNISKAHDGGNKLSTIFKKLNIDTSDNEKALRRVFEVLQQETNATEKARLAKEFFGKSYKDMLGIIEASNGDLDGAIERFRELGTLIDSDMAAKADKLGDQITELGQIFKGVATQIGIEIAPYIIGTLDNIGSEFSKNKDGIVAGLKLIVDTIGILVKALLGWLLLLGRIKAVFSLGIAIAGGAKPKTGEELAMDSNTATTAALIANSAGQFGRRAGTGIGAGGGGGGSAKADPRIKALEGQGKEAERIYKDETEALKKQYDQRRTNLQTYTDGIIALEKKFYEQRQTIILQQRALAKPGEQGKFDNELAGAESERNKNIYKAFADQAKELLALKRELEAKILDVQDEFDERNINAVRARIQLEENTEVEGERRIAEIEEAAYERRKAALMQQQNELIIAVGGKRAEEVIKRLEEDAELGKKGLEESLNFEETERLLTVEQKEKLTTELALLTLKANQEEFTRLDAQLTLLEQTEITAGEERERRIAGAEANRLQRATELNRSLMALERDHAANERELEIEQLQRLNATLGFSYERLARLTEIYLQEAEAKHRSVGRQLDDDERAALRSVKGAKDEEARKLEIKRAYNDLKLDEQRRYEEENRRIEQESAERARGESIEGLNPFGSAGTDEFIKSGDVLKAAFSDLKQMGLDAFGALADGFGQMVGRWASGANLGEQAMRKMVGTILSGVAAQATTMAVMFTAYGIASLTPWGSVLFGPAAPWFQAAALMGTIAVGTALLGRAISPKQASAGAGGGSASAGAGGSDGSPQYRPFNYNSQTPSSSQANGDGSRGGMYGGMVDVIRAGQEKVVQSNYAVVSEVRALRSHIGSINGGDFIVANPDAVGTSLQTAFQQGHPVKRDVVSAGSTGLI